MTTILAMYRDAGAYVRRCSGLFLLVVAVELAQHLVEYRAGFYDSVAAMKAAEHDPLRMAAGHAKMLLLFATDYWALRFYAFGNDARAPLRRDPRALRLFVPVVVWGLLTLVLTEGGPFLAEAMGVASRPLMIVLLGIILLMSALEVGLSAWVGTAAVGNPRPGFLGSIRLMRGHWWWSIAISAAAILPAMALHYAFAFLSLGRGAAATAAVLVADSMLVGYMGALMAASTYAIARRVTAAAGLPIVPVRLAPAH